MFDEYLTQLTNNNNSKVWTIMCRINFQNRYLRGFWLHFVIVLEFKLNIYTCIPEEFFRIINYLKRHQEVEQMKFIIKGLWNNQKEIDFMYQNPIHLRSYVYV